MADSEQVLTLLEPAAEVEIIGIVVNLQGAERALRTGAVRTLGFPYSISPTFLARNQKQTQDQARQTLASIAGIARKEGLGVVAYISMAFGNPYGDPWRVEDVLAACQELQAMGVDEISLADTVGLATPEQIGALLSAFPAACSVPGVHLHARREDARQKVRAAYQAGCRRLDMALGGQGGCPFAQDALVGNVATEDAVEELREAGADLPPLKSMQALLPVGHAIADRFGVASTEPSGSL
jgi:hydroxymethylglutaryl-CoA lyase